MAVSYFFELKEISMTDFREIWVGNFICQNARFPVLTLLSALRILFVPIVKLIGMGDYAVFVYVSLMLLSFYFVVDFLVLLHLSQSSNHFRSTNSWFIWNKVLSLLSVRIMSSESLSPSIYSLLNHKIPPKIVSGKSPLYHRKNWARFVKIERYTIFP